MIDEHVRGAMLAAGDPAAPWPEQVRDRLAALLDALSRDALSPASTWSSRSPPEARSPPATATRCSFLPRRCAPRPAPETNVEVRDQVLMGGIATLISRRLKKEGAESLGDLLPDLVELTLAPYIGRDEARLFAQRTAI